MKSFQAIFMKPSTIMDYSYGKNPLNFDDDPSQNGRVAASLDFCYNILHITHFRRHSVGVASVFRVLYMNLCDMKAPPGECQCE